MTDPDGLHDGAVVHNRKTDEVVELWAHNGRILAFNGREVWSVDQAWFRRALERGQLRIADRREERL